MKISHFTLLKDQLENLSQRFDFYASNNNGYSNHTDLNIKANNLKYNLSYLLAKIILKLKISNPSIQEFEEIIHNYNKRNKLSLSLDDYLSIGWLRIINDKVILPEVVRHFAWKIGYDENNSKTINFPPNKEHHLRCLSEFYSQYNSDNKASITKKQLSTILQDSNVDIPFLEKQEIIELSSRQSNIYTWKAHDYMRYLRNEVASTLWILLYDESQNIISFRRFIHFLKLFEYCSPNKIQDFLPINYITKLSDYSIEFLNNEVDLNNSEIEFNKIWLDAARYIHVDLTDKIPKVEIKGDSPLNLLLEEKNLEWFFPSIFDIQSARSSYYQSLLFIAYNKNKQCYPFENYLSQLQKINKPYLIGTIYNQIKRHFPQTIPYLLLNTDYIPIAFKLINEIEFNSKVLSLDSSHEKRIEASSNKRTEFWIDSFKIILRIKPQNKDNISGEVVFQILYNLVKQVFIFNQNNSTALIIHNSYRKCYDEALKLLSESDTETRSYNFNTGLHSKPKLFPNIASELVNSALNTSNFLPQNEFANFDIALVDLLIEILKLCHSTLQRTELTLIQKENLENSIQKITTFLANKIQDYYTITDIEVWASNDKEMRKIRHGHHQFGYEIIDWGELYLQFSKQNLIDSIDDTFKTALIFDTTHEAGKYAELNKEQEVKIRLYIKSLLLAYISINNNKQQFPDNEPILQTALIKLENLINYYVKTYSKDDITKRQIDVFDEKYTYLYQDIYYQKLTPLLFHAINNFKCISQTQVLKSYFAQLEDITRMLSAINILTNTEHKKFISTLIEQIDINSFASNASINTLEQVLIEAVNSENYWTLTEPLLEKVQERLKQTKLGNNDNAQDFLFRVKLLLAFKQKKWTLLNEIEVPKYKHRANSYNRKGVEYKQFYIALYKIYYDQDFTAAEKILNSLLSSNSKNIEYHYYLYYAQTQKAYLNNKELLPKIKLEWDKFLYDKDGNSLEFSDEQMKKLSNLNESIDGLNVIHYSYLKDYTRFDQSVNKLSDNYLYEEIISECIYQTYIDRQMHETADSYINQAIIYYEKQNNPVPQKISSINLNPKSPFLLKKYQTTLNNIRSLSPADLVSIVPSNINNKREVNTFILNELVQALKIALEKIKSVEQIKHENKYNDLVLAILRFRFPIWGWTILDQPRVGVASKKKTDKKTTKKDAGSIDHLIQVSGNNIALFEALILTGRNKTTTTNHILKLEKYIPYINQYYVIIYYKGKPKNFSNTWKSYKEVVQAITYPNSFKINKGFQALNNDFSNIRFFEIAKTLHGDGNKVELYHVMVDFSDKN